MTPPVTILFFITTFVFRVTHTAPKVVIAAICCICTLFATAAWRNHAAAAERAVTPEITEIASGVWVLQGKDELMSEQNLGHIANTGFIIGTRAVAVIDTGGSIHFGKKMLALIQAHTDLPIRYVINTHMHPDHVFGNGAFGGPDVEFVGHHKLAAAFAARGVHYLNANHRIMGDAAMEGVTIVTPNLAVEDRLELNLGGRMLRLIAHRAAHTDNDLSVWDSKTGTLWLGDLLFASHLPVIDVSLKGWLSLISELRETLQGVTRVVPGHGPPVLPWPDALDAQERYLTKLLHAVRTAVAQGQTLTKAVETISLADEAPRWALFDEFHKRNVATAFTELEWE